MNTTKKKQVMRLSDEELQILKGVFAENDDLLKSMRRVLLQLPVTAVDLASLQQLKDGGIQAVLSKLFLPVLDGDVPLGQQIDLWMTVQISDKSADFSYDHILARKLLIQLLTEGLERLGGGKDKSHVRLLELIEIKGKTVSEIYQDLIARNTYINHIEQQLIQILMLAGMKDESLEETQERLKRDSAK